MSAVALGARNAVHIDWHPSGDEYGPIPVVEISRHRLTADDEWSFVGSITIRATNDLDELANAIAAGARLAATWRAEHGG